MIHLSTFHPSRGPGTLATFTTSLDHSAQSVELNLLGIHDGLESTELTWSALTLSLNVNNMLKYIRIRK